MERNKIERNPESWDLGNPDENKKWGSRKADSNCLHNNREATYCKM